MRGKYRTEQNEKGKDQGIRIMKRSDGKDAQDGENKRRRKCRTERLQNEENKKRERMQDGENIGRGK